MSVNEAENNMSDAPAGEVSHLTPDKLIKEIRTRTRLEIEKFQDERKPFAPKPPEPNAGKEYQAGELLRSQELSFLNEFCAQTEHLKNDHLESHRGGLIGKFVTKTKKRIHAFIFNLLDKYITSQRDFQVNLVRHLNSSAKYIDGRDMANFWELIRKIDVDVQKALDRIERISDEQTGTLRTQEKWVNELVRSNVVELKDTVSKHSSEIQTLDGVARGLESLVSRIEKTGTNNTLPTAEESQDQGESFTDYSYLLLENRYRGSEESISDRLKIYPEIFKESATTDSSLPVLEIGPGRGELLELFRDSSMTAYGVDIDSAMVESATAKGLDAKLGDGIAHLRSLEDRSLSGVIAIQVVEHLTREQLQELFSLCLKKVVPGGRVVFETINPRSLLALSSNYFRDPTHIWPLHPDTLEYSMNLSGLKSVETRFLSEVERDSQLRALPVEEYMSPRLAHTIQTINRNFEQLNALLYGFQDYCIIAEVPEMNGEG